MSKLGWIIAIPVIAILVVFAVTNTQSVVITIWPFVTVETKVFLLVLVIFFIGFWAGWIGRWFAKRPK